MAIPADLSPRRWLARGLLASACAGVTLLPPALGQPLILPAEEPAEGIEGKEHNEFVFVRDSASAQEKFALAQKMERLKEWNKSADLYQEVLEKYRDRVIPSGKDSDNVINRYTSVTWGVLGQLANWPQEGLDIYRGRYESRAAQLVANFRGDDLGPLYEALRKYFVTESGKQAAIKLIDANLERGEYAAAAEIGDQLLSLYPKANLVAERPAVLFRTALAHALTGSTDGQNKSQQLAAALTTESPKVMGVVRGQDTVLAEALQIELKAIGTGATEAVTASGDSWPTMGGGPTRAVISAAKANAGTRLYSLALAAGNFNSLPNAQVRQQAQQQYASAAQSGHTIGVMPVVDRGELFVNDGARVYAVNLESGVPLAGWLQSYPASGGQYLLPNVTGSTRMYQQTVTVTDRHVLAVMGQQDRNLMMFGVAPQGESRLVCLDRATGREVWTISLQTTPDIPKNDDEKAIRTLSMSGAPLVVGDSVLAVGRSSRNNQGEDCYVLSFDVNTGKFRWACYVASSGAPANMYGAPPANDKTSHLAYANGRVYVMTNLGAVAALDAYSGTIVWLNIYPLDQQKNVRGRQFNPFVGGRQTAASKLKPWQFNPVLLADGKVFVLPDEGKNLLIYDAVTGRDIKRISLEGLAKWNNRSGSGQAEQTDRPATLVGINGPRMVLASESRLLCIDWQAYDEGKFPGTDDSMIFWPSTVPDRLVGRPFMTADAVYMSDTDRLRRLDIKSGLAVNQYPAWPRQWDEDEGPGNVIVSGDHVILAGADSVDVYTDLTLATAKLDAEVAAAPNDPEPRLRYAEVMFVAGQGREAVRRLDEAIKLLGGAEKLLPGANRDRLFNDALTFAVRSVGDDRPETRDLVLQYFDRAGQSAGNPQQFVQYRVARAKFAIEQQKDPTTAVRLYHEILAMPETRAVSLLNERSSLPTQAENVAENAIAAIVKEHGPSIYQPYEQQAQTAVKATESEADDVAKAGRLLSVSQAYPNSSVAPEAMLSAAAAYESASKPREAVRVLREMWFKHQSGPNRTAILEGIARNYLAVPDRSRADMASIAAARLSMAAAMPGDPKLSKDLKLSDGKILVSAGTPIQKALDDVRKLSSEEAGKTLADFRLPIPKWGQKPYPKAFLPKTDAMVLPDALALVLPSRDHGRADRVITWSPTKLSIFAAGKGAPTTPLSVSNAFPDTGRGVDAAPRGVSWVGDTAIVWSGSRAVAIDSKSGKTLWTVDVASLAGLEVVRGGDTPGTPAGNDANVRIVNNGQVVINRLNGPVVIRNGVVIRGGAAVPAQLPAQGGNIAPAVPLPPTPGMGEQVADVRPIGDRILLTSSTGRLLAAELSNGKVTWQARLAEKTPDRVVATEDFTVVRVSDDLKVQLFAIDTYSGRIIGNRAFATQSGSVPINMALSADGTLVYTLPDRLCLRDLYKNWDEDEKVITSGGQGQPAQPIYANANQPGQLVIAEGRILAVADSINVSGLSPNEKYVRVHSLETGQPLSLKYTVDGNNKREVDQVLTAGTKDWNVMLRTVGSKVYVIGPKTVYGYNLDKPAETWRGSTDIFDAGPNDMNFCDGFIGTSHLVILDQPTPAAENAKPQYRLHAFARYSSAQAKGESGKLDYSVVVSDPAGVAPQWQAADGGFYYATSDGKVRVLVGSDQER